MGVYLPLARSLIMVPAVSHGSHSPTWELGVGLYICYPWDWDTRLASFYSMARTGDMRLLHYCLSQSAVFIDTEVCFLIYKGIYFSGT